MVSRLFLRSSVLLVIALMLITSGCSTQSSKGEAGSKVQSSDVKSRYYTPQKLRIGLIPNISPDKQKTKYEPFAKYLEGKLGVPVELFVATSYTGVVQAMASGKLDLAYFGGLTYAQALQQVELDPIVTEVDKETGTTKYYSEIITGMNSGINSLSDLKGKTFAFGDPSSTSGSLYPRMMLTEAGYNWKENFAPLSLTIYTGGHDATAQAVVNGKVDAGGIEGRILNALIKSGKVDGSKIKVLSKREVEGYPWCVPSNLDPKFRTKIVNAFLAIDKPELLDLMRAKKYVTVSSNDYKEVVKQGIKYGLVSPKM